MLIIPEFLPQFKEYLSIILGRRPGTVNRYVRALELFYEWFEKKGGAGGTGSLNIEDIRRPDVEDWLKDLYYHQGNLKNVTRASKLSAIKAFWRFLLVKEYIKHNPIALIPSPKASRPMAQKFSTQQLSKILSGPDPSTPRGVRDLAVLMTLYGTGPRVQEISNLNMDNIRLSGKDIFLHYFTKGDKERVVCLKRTPAESLVAWLSIRDRFGPIPGPLFIGLHHNNRGGRLSVNAFNAILKKYAALVGIKNERVFTHKMRATFATDLYDQGFDILRISYIMGHESIETTKRYIAISETALIKTAIPEKRWKEIRKIGD